MLDPSVLTDLEELTLCSYCKQKFNDSEQCPKYLDCKHHFCLRCIEHNLLKGKELFCAHCWKRTELGDHGPDALPTHSPLLALANHFSHLKINSNNTTTTTTTITTNKPNDKERKSENCHTHGMPLALWCATCCTAICRACAIPQEHPGHQIKSQTDAKDQLISDVQHELIAIRKLSSEIQRLVMHQREFLIKVLESCVTLKTRVETDLQNGWSYFPEITEAREALGEAKASLQIIENPVDIYNLHTELILKKQKLQVKYQEATVQCQLDDIIGNSGVIFDFTLLKQALANINMGEPILPQSQNIGTGGIRQQQQHGHIPASQNPILFLANYCMSQLYSRHIANKQQVVQQNGTIDYHGNMMPPVVPPVHIHQGAPPPPPSQLLIPTVSPSLKQPAPTLQNPMLHPQQQPTTFITEVIPNNGTLLAIHSPPQSQSVINTNLRAPPPNPYPLYYFNIDVNGSPQGRIVIEVRPDVAPKMAKNFSVLATGEIGVGYKGCTIFQCWEGESVITGDFELNNGRGGRSIFEDGFFMPDDTKFPAVRGAVGMRRTQKRHDNLGMVGSQFRIILREMRGFTGIFGHVVEGLDLIEKLSTYGDQTGKPTKTILITKSGKL